MARLVTVYSTERRAPELVDMSYIRWFKMSEALGRLGHRVDIATGEFRWRLSRGPVEHAPNVRRVPLSAVRWDDYDVVKTLFHRGYLTLEERGGAGHAFVIAKLGSVVDARDRAGIFYYGKRRERLYAVQERIARGCRYVTLLTRPARELWKERFGTAGNVLLVPGATEREIPPPTSDPYPEDGRPRCVYAGNFYTTRRRSSQPRAHRSIANKLNDLGRRLADRGIRLYVVGPGEAAHLDDGSVTYLGSVPYADSWDYLYHATVGIALVPGPFLHNNESTKLYHYLRAGLPVVSEEGFPNDDVVRRSGLGFVVENGRIDVMAERVEEAAGREWPADRAEEYVLEHHTWEHRARVYDRLLRRSFPDRGPGETS